MTVKKMGLASNLDAGVGVERSCQSCVDWRPNGTRYGGRCHGKSDWYGLITSALKDDCLAFRSVPASLRTTKDDL